MRPFVLNKTFVYKVDETIKPVEKTTTTADLQSFMGKMQQTISSYEHVPKIMNRTLGSDMTQGVDESKRSQHVTEQCLKLSRPHVRNNTDVMASPSSLSRPLYYHKSFEITRQQTQRGIRRENSQDSQFNFEKLSINKNLRIKKVIRNHGSVARPSMERVDTDFQSDVKRQLRQSANRPQTSGNGNTRNKLRNADSVNVIQKRLHRRVSSRYDGKSSIHPDRFQFINGQLHDTWNQTSVSTKTPYPANSQKSGRNQLNSFEGLTQTTQIASSVKLTQAATTQETQLTFEEIRIETLFRKFKFPPQAETYLTRHNQSPLYLCQTEGQDIEKAIRKGEVSQLIDSLKQQTSDEAQNNLAVAYVLNGEFKLALPLLQGLKRKYDKSTAILSNLLFCFLCMGKTHRIKAAQEIQLVQQFEPPLNEQARSVLKMIKFANLSILDQQSQQSAQSVESVGIKSTDEIINIATVSSVPRLQSIRFGTRSNESVSWQPTLASLVGITGLTQSNQNVPLLNEESADEVDVGHEKTYRRDASEDQVGFANFVFKPKITRGRRSGSNSNVVPISHLLKKVLRPNKRNLQAGKVNTEFNYDCSADRPNHEAALKTFEARKHVQIKEKKQAFNQNLAKLRRLCTDTDEFQRGVKTQIIKDERRRNIDFENTKEVVSTDILQVPITQENLKKQKESQRAVGPEMDHHFKELVRTSVNLDSSNPHAEEQKQICLELRAFEDRFTIEEIVLLFLEERKDQTLNDRKVVKVVTAQFQSFDPKVQRARTLILELLSQTKSTEQALKIQTDLEAMAKLAEEIARQGYLNFDRLQHENYVNGDIKDLRKLSADYKREQRLKALIPGWKPKRKQIRLSNEPNVAELMSLTEHVNQQLQDTDPVEQVIEKMVQRKTLKQEREKQIDFVKRLIRKNRMKYAFQKFISKETDVSQVDGKKGQKVSKAEEEEMKQVKCRNRIANAFLYKILNKLEELKTEVESDPLYGFTSVAEVKDWMHKLIRDQLTSHSSQCDKALGNLSADQRRKKWGHFLDELMHLYNQLLIKRLDENKELKGVTDTQLAMRTFGATKADLRQRDSIEQFFHELKPISYRSPDTEHLNDLERRAVERQRNLNFEECEQIRKQVRMEVDQIEEKSKAKFEKKQAKAKEAKEFEDRGLFWIDLDAPISAIDRDKRKKVLSKTQKKLVAQIFTVKDMQAEVRKNFCMKIVESAQTFFNEKTMKIQSKDGNGFCDWTEELFEPPADYFELCRKMKQIDEHFSNIDAFLDRDTEKIKPFLKQWNSTNAEFTEKISKQLAKSIQWSVHSQTGAYDKAQKGRDMTEESINRVEKLLNRFDELSALQLLELDGIMLTQCKIFATFEKLARMSIYKSLKIERVQGADKVIAFDAEETENVQIILKGSVRMMLYKHDAKTSLEIGQLVSGEVCGDESIQRKFMNVMKIVEQDRKFYQNITEDTVVAKIDKKEFIAAIFQEMSEELFYKIVLLRSTPYFSDLSPYSLVTIASNVEVKEMAYGEIVIHQGVVPEAMFILAYGNTKAVFLTPETQPTKPGKRNSLATKSTLKAESKLLGKEHSKLQKLFKEQLITKQNDGDKCVVEQHVDLTQRYLDIAALMDKAKKNLESRKGTFQPVSKADVLKETSQRPEFIVVGQNFGQRSLLENQTVRNYISLNKVRLCDRLKVNIKQAEQQLRDVLFKQQQGEEQARQIRSIAVKQQYKFCQACFEEDKPKCDCLLLKLTDSQRELALSEEQKSNPIEVKSPLITCDFDQDLAFVEDSLMQEMPESGDVVLDTFKQVKDEVNSHLREIKRTKTPEKESKKESAEFEKQRKIEEMLVDQLHSNLIKSQASIMVTSATAKFLVVRKEHKAFLDAYLKVCIDKAVLDEDFFDYDRPLPTFEDVQLVVARNQKYRNWKHYYQDMILNEKQAKRVKPRH